MPSSVRIPQIGRLCASVQLAMTLYPLHFSTDLVNAAAFLDLESAAAVTDSISGCRYQSWTRTPDGCARWTAASTCPAWWA